MRPDTRSVSFTFHRQALTDLRNSPETTQRRRNFRQRLQDRFDKEKINDSTKDKKAIAKKTDKQSWNNINLSTVSADSRRALRNGAEKLSKTILSVRTTIGTISQKFRSSTCRRQILDEQQSPTACNSQTPQTRSRHLLGRTPTKLYSPFGIESPKHAWNKENCDSTPPSAASTTRRKRESRSFCFIKTRGFTALR